MTLTGILDGLTKDPAKSEIYGGEFFSRIIEAPIDVFTSALGGKLFKFVLGLATMFLANQRGGTMSRTGRELHEIASHMMLSILDPTPEQIVRLKEDIENIKRSIGLGNLDDVLRALFRDPDEVKLAVLGRITPAPAVSKPATTAKPAPKRAAGLLLEERE